MTRKQLLEIAIAADRKDCNGFRHGIAETEDLRLFAEAATREGLAGIIYRGLVLCRLSSLLPQEASQILSQRYHRNLLENMRNIHAVKELLQKMQHSRIEPILLQGISLIEKCYTDPGLRQMEDIDILIEPSYRDETIRILKSLGYRPSPDYPLNLIKNGIRIDLHTDLMGADRIETRKRILIGGQTPILQRSRPTTFEGMPARRLDPVDQVLYLIFHGFKHNFGRLLWFMDIRRIVADWSGSQWRDLFARASSFGQERTLRIFAFMAKEAMALSPPQWLGDENKWQRFGMLEKKIITTWVRRCTLPSFTALLLYAPGSNTAERLRHAMATFYPPVSIMQQVFKGQETRRWVLYSRRTLQIVKNMTAIAKEWVD